MDKATIKSEMAKARAEGDDAKFRRLREVLRSLRAKTPTTPKSAESAYGKL